MKKLGWMVALVVIAVACGSGADMMGEIMDSGVPDAGAQPGTGEGMKLVGYTSEALQGNAGIFELYAACQSDFGAGHRVCTEEEVVYTTALPAPPTNPAGAEPGPAWLLRSNAGLSSCLRSNDSGPTLTGGGTFSSALCGNFFRAACCGPK
jgi:hypothetical protein